MCSCMLWNIADVISFFFIIITALLEAECQRDGHLVQIHMAMFISLYVLRMCVTRCGIPRIFMYVDHTQTAL